jgi:hypothetical protein
MTPSKAKEALDSLFEGHLDVLLDAIAMLRSESAPVVAQSLIEPVIGDISTKAGQPMDATFLAYLIEYAYYPDPDRDI